MSQCTVVVGAQWGDEGKGKWIDAMSEGADVVVRYQGGNNAGHTIYFQGRKLVLHLLPAGILTPGKVVALSAGVVINPQAFWAEIEGLSGLAEIDPERLWLSGRSHVITPWQVYLDAKSEEGAFQPIGTTRRGIGPTYGSKIHRTGLRLETYVDEKSLEGWLQGMRLTSQEFKAFEASHSQEWRTFFETRHKLAPFVCDVESRLREQTQRPKARILFEGAQGTLLDIDHGTYPYVTSSSTIAAGAVSSAGLDPRKITKVYGVAKAYLTRVGEGPFPTELKNATGEWLRKQGQEFGATTKRPRRCGWFDAVAMRYAQSLNGFDGVFLNKIDVLTGLETLKIAVAYEHPIRGRMDVFPSDVNLLMECHPIYQEFPGWSQELPKSGRLKDLPYEARHYLDALCETSGIRLKAIGCGPHKDHFLEP